MSVPFGAVFADYLADALSIASARRGSPERLLASGSGEQNDEILESLVESRSSSRTKHHAGGCHANSDGPTDSGVRDVGIASYAIVLEE